MEYSPPGSFVHGILQARILEWVAIPFTGDSNPGIESRSPALQADSLQSEPRGKPTLTRVYVTEHSSRMLLESKQCHSWLKTLEKKISPAQEKPHEITNAKLEPRSSEKQVGWLPVLKIGPAALIQMLRINNAVNHPGWKDKFLERGLSHLSVVFKTIIGTKWL